MKENLCVLCNTNASVKVLYASNVRMEDFSTKVFSARRAPDRVHGEIYQCKCGLIFPREILSQEKLSSLYEHSFFSYDELVPYIQKTYKRYILKAKKFLEPREHLTYLDIGCGNGFMLELAQKLGFEAHGIEPSIDAIQKAHLAVRANIKNGMLSQDSFPPHSFDLITCFQTLDHIQDPIAFLSACHAFLKPGGIMLCINHDTKSFTSRILGEKSPIIDVEHTFLHTKKTMKKIFQKTGFQPLSVFSVRNDYPISYWLHLFPVFLGLKKILFAITKLFKLQSVVLSLYAGNLGLIARK